MQENDLDSGELSPSRLLLLLVPLFVILAGGLWYASTLIVPPPQKVVVISTGGEAGAYHAFGKLYQQHLKASGISSELRTSAGSIENLRRLKDPKSGVSVALLQGGVADRDSTEGLVSIGRMFYEPLWVFYKSDKTFDRIADLKGLKIAVGSEGSGTRKLAMTLLGASNVTADNATLLPISGPPAVEDLRKGNLDAVLLTFAPEAPLIKDLLHDPSIKLMSMAQAAALSRVYPYLAHVTLPAGVVDLEKNIPERDVDLVAPIAALVVSDDLHPALVGQLAEAASRIHAGPNLLAPSGTFPRTLDPEFQMSDDALRFYKNGPSFLQRYLPFYWANFLQRMLVLLVPLAGIALPLMRVIPAFNRWRVHRKLSYWYRRLKRLEMGIGRKGAGTLSAGAQAREITAISDAVAAMSVPRAYSEQYYNLRAHVDLVQARLGVRALPAEAA